ncbi:MAG TPA: transglycosylase domain-containing protein, partial [Chitinophagales bacterium]|nr:transglycosylase domain-containing protein [Chitinophagales bacterium]
MTTQPNNYQHYIRLMWKVYFSLVILVLALFIGVAQGLLGTLPTFIELESPKSSLASEVYSSDGVLLGKFFLVDRSNVNFEEIPRHTIDALVATEDIRYFTHSGIDFRGMLRVFLKTVIGGKDSGGGSTITQQLAKNLFHDRQRNTFDRIKQKLKEWVIAVKLERSYTKEEILAMYFNTVPFGNNAYGIKSASQTYFNAATDSLKIQEGAMLVGLLKGNTKYNPRRNPQNALERRNVVLSQMHKYGKLSLAQRDSLIATELGVQYSPMMHDEGLATYFREYVKQEVKNWAAKNVRVDGTNYDIYRDGLKIYTTIDSRIQQYAEEAVAEHMPELQKQFYDHWKGRTPWDELPNAKLPKTDVWYGTNELIYRAIKNSERYKVHKEQNLSEENIKQQFTTPHPMT